MGRIQSNVGLVTGINIGDTVDKLMALEQKPRDMLSDRTETLKKEQVAVTELSALLLTTRYATANLGKADLYQQRNVTSSNDSALAAKVTGQPALGNYQFTPLRTAQLNQYLSSGFKSDQQPIGAGTITFRFGSNVQRNSPLELLNGGQGITPGKIRITDRSGQSADIDLSTVKTLDDVLEAINGNTQVNVTAEVQGDHLRLVDRTGQSVSDLMVQEIGKGATAASLGLAGVRVAGAAADGQDLVRLTRELALDALNDGNGLSSSQAMPDIYYELRDGTKGSIDLSPIVSGSSQVKKESTLGEVIDTINAAAPGKLKVQIAPDGDRLVVSDLTQGTGAFKLTSGYDSEALADLGLDGAAAEDTITGRRILGGLKSVLLSSLGGGKGLGKLGTLALTDRSGAQATVDLSSAETLDDVVEKLNSSGLGIQARVNDARNGIELVDTTQASASHLIVADSDASGTAAKLHLATDAEVTSVNSGDLHLKVVSRSTRLADLNGGAGVAKGKITFLDSKGRQDVLRLDGDKIQTVDDVIRSINRLGASVRAELNETGDGIRVVDLAGGSGKLRILDSDSTAAADLHLTGTAVEKEIDGVRSQLIDGSSTYTVQISATDTLADLKTKINQSGAGVQASILVDGSGKPYRLSLTSQRSGQAGQLLVDTSQASFSLDETVRARDALLALGHPGSSGSSLLISSSTNKFNDVVSGMSLEVKQASASPVTVTVQQVDTNLVATVQTMVDNYNKFRARLNAQTKYDPETNKSEILANDSSALRLDTDLSGFFSGRFFGVGSIQSLAEVGVGIKEDGTLSFDSSRLKQKYADDPEAVKKFFADEKSGLAKKFEKLTDALVGQDKSLMAHRFLALKQKIQDNEDRITWLDARLAKEKESLTMKFYNMELAIGKIQSNLSAISAIQPITMNSGSGSGT